MAFGVEFWYLSYRAGTMKAVLLALHGESEGLNLRSVTSQPPRLTLHWSAIFPTMREQDELTP
jgi:hypothetical protein